MASGIMGTKAAGVPVLVSAGEAVRFLKENWRFVGAVAIAGSAAQLLIALALRQTPLVYIPMTLISAAVYAALLGCALHGLPAVRQRLARDTLRIWLAMGLVGGFLIVLMLALVFVAMSVLIAPYAEELRAVGENAEAATAIFMRAVAERRGVAIGLFAACFAIWLALTSRLYLAAPASLEAQRPRVFDTWTWTKNNLWRIAAARIAVLAPAAALWFSIHGMIGAALGLGINNPFDPAAAQQLSDASPVLFIVQLALSQAVQIALPVALEAGLSAYLFRVLKTPA